MPANKKMIAGMARSYGILFEHALACDDQRPVRCQPRSDVRAQHIIADLICDLHTALRPYPHQ